MMIKPSIMRIKSLPVSCVVIVQEENDCKSKVRLGWKQRLNRGVSWGRAQHRVDRPIAASLASSNDRTRVHKVCSDMVVSGQKDCLSDIWLAVAEEIQEKWSCDCVL